MRKKRKEGENRGYWKDMERIRIIRKKKGKKKGINCVSGADGAGLVGLGGGGGWGLIWTLECIIVVLDSCQIG